MTIKRIDTEQKQININIAMDHRLAGLSYRQIGTEMGVSGSTAYNYVKEAIRMCQEEYTEKADTLITLELTKLNKLENALYEKALEGDLKVLDRILKISDHRAKLAGLYAPTKTDNVHDINDDREVKVTFIKGKNKEDLLEEFNREDD